MSQFLLSLLIGLEYHVIICSTAIGQLYIPAIWHSCNVFTQLLKGHQEKEEEDEAEEEENEEEEEEEDESPYIELYSFLRVV